MSTSSFYTKTGDDGYTGLLGAGRVPKYHPRPETCGTIDEATATLGLARAFSKSPQSAGILLQVQRDLYGLMAEVAATPENAERFRSISADRVAWLEAQADALQEVVAMPKAFILPGDSQAGGFLALARTIVRRAERLVTRLLHEGDLQNPELGRYLNRLSSLCFALELLENQTAGKETTLTKETP